MEITATTLLTTPLAACPLMIAWLYRGGRNDDDAKDPPCANAVRTPINASVISVVAMTASPDASSSYVNAPVAANKIAIPSSGAGTRRNDDSFGMSLARTTRHSARTLANVYVTAKTPSNESASARANGGVKSLLSKYARSVMKMFHGNNVPAPARKRMTYVMSCLRWTDGRTDAGDGRRMSADSTVRVVGLNERREREMRARSATRSATRVPIPGGRAVAHVLRDVHRGVGIAV